jgi:hypothetical protein
VSLVLEALCIDFVDVLCAGGSGREPAVGSYDFQAPDWGVVARSASQLGSDGLSGQSRFLDGLRRQFLQPGFLLGRRWSVDARVVGRAELRGQFAVVLSRILARTGGDLRCQQVHDEAVLVGRPHRAVAP